MAPPMRIVLSLFSLSWRRSRTRWPAMDFVSLSIDRGDLRTSRPPRLRARQHLLDEQTGLGQDSVVAAAARAQNELRHAGVDVFGDAREDRVGVADRERVRGVASGAFGVGIHRASDAGRVTAAEVEREAGAIMVLVDQSAGFG